MSVPLSLSLFLSIPRLYVLGSPVARHGHDHFLQNTTTTTTIQDTKHQYDYRTLVLYMYIVRPALCVTINYTCYGRGQLTHQDCTFTIYRKCTRTPIDNTKQAARACDWADPARLCVHGLVWCGMAGHSHATHMHIHTFACTRQNTFRAHARLQISH